MNITTAARSATVLAAALLAGCTGGYGSRSVTQIEQSSVAQPPPSRISSYPATPLSAYPLANLHELPARQMSNDGIQVTSGDSNGALVAVVEFRKDDDNGQDKNGAGNGEKNGSEGKGKEVAKKPPRTLPEALCAYWERLKSHPCANNSKEGASESKNGDGATTPEPDGKKSPPLDGSKESDQPKKNASDSEPKGKKSPALDGSKKNGESKKQRSGEEPQGKKSPPVSGEQDTPEKEKEKDGGDVKGDGDAKSEKEEPKESWLSAHAQATMDMQRHPNIRSPYAGMFSLSPLSETRTSLTSTLFLDARLWECGGYSSELVFNPEIAGGRGFSGVNGIAGFSNGEITRVGVPEPTPYFARFFLRQTWGLGGEQETADDGPNQIAGKRDVNRFTLSVGKFAFTDVIDNNNYSHDPRTQMTNWSLMYNGAWDYPANVRGYDYGVAMEYNEKDWALRYGIMAEPIVANGAPIDPHFTQAFGQALEWEGRWAIDTHPGRVRLMSYLNRANMGDYREALLHSPLNPDVTQTRSYRYKYGCGLSAEQEINRDLGVWARLGWNDGHTESWAFTPIDRTAALGLLLKGTCWARPDDAIGLATACNGIARDHRDYLRAGGLDFSIGDGRLNYGLEKIVEMYYRLAIVKGMFVTADYQFIANPAYNRDRGPVSVESLLVHIEY